MGYLWPCQYYCQCTKQPVLFNSVGEMALQHLVCASVEQFWDILSFCEKFWMVRIEV